MSTVLLAVDDQRKRFMLDGADLTVAIQSFTLTGGVGNSICLHLELTLDEIQIGLDGEPAQLFLSDETRRLLIKYGWTPPKDGE